MNGTDFYPSERKDNHSDCLFLKEKSIEKIELNLKNGFR